MHKHTQTHTQTNTEATDNKITKRYTQQTHYIKIFLLGSCVAKNFCLFL